MAKKQPAGLQYTPVVLQDFSGGWNPKWALNATQLADNQSPKMVNIDYASRFGITKRRGMVKVGANALAASGNPSSIFTFIQPDASEILLSAVGTKMRYLDSNSNWQDVPNAITFTADKKFAFESYNTLVFFGNGVDSMMSWDGNGAHNATAYAGNPKGNIFGSGFLRLFVAGVSTNSTTLYYSVVGDYSDFAGAGSGNTAFPFNIKSLLTFFLSSSTEVLQVVLANGDIYHFSFNSDGSPNKQRVRQNLGSLAHRANKQVENANLVLDSFAQVRGVGYQSYVTDIRAEPRSILIDSYMSTLDLSDACSVYFPRNYLLTGKETAAASNNTTLLYDENYQSWRLYQGFGAKQYAVFQKKICFASASDPAVYQFDSTKYNDNNVPIYCEYQTKDLDFGTPIDEKTVRYIKIFGLISKGCLITVYGYVNGNTTAPVFTKTINGNGAYVSSIPAPMWGSYAQGTIPFAGFGGSKSTIQLFYFEVTMSIAIDPFFHMRLAFVNQQSDVDFVITQIKPYTDLYDGERAPTNTWI